MTTTNDKTPEKLFQEKMFQLGFLALKDKPNYRLSYRAHARDDWLDGEQYFIASSDKEAQRRAQQYIEERNKFAEELIEKGEIDRRERVLVSFQALHRLKYTVRTVIEETPIPLQAKNLEGKVSNSST